MLEGFTIELSPLISFESKDNNKRTKTISILTMWFLSSSVSFVRLESLLGDRKNRLQCNSTRQTTKLFSSTNLRTFYLLSYRRGVLKLF